MATHARWEFRLEIEGLGIEAVTHPDMEQTLSGGTNEGRIRVAGLKRDGLGFSEKVDLVRSSTSGKAFTAKIVDRQRDTVWTKWFTQEPAYQTFLTKDLSTSGTSVWVLDDSNIAAGDIVHVGTEAMRVTGNTVSKRLTVTRAHFGSIAQAHYTQDVEKLSMPIVTVTRPLTLEGRRARLYRYQVGTDSLTGDGTQIYTGFITKDAKLSQNLAEWTIAVDSPYSLLKQDMGGTLEEEIPARGIYYPPQAPLVITVREFVGTSTYGVGADVDDSIRLSISGFYANQQAFVDEVNSQLASNTTEDGLTGVSGWNSNEIRAVSDGEAGWHFEWVAGSTLRNTTFEMRHPVDGRFVYTSASADRPGNRTNVAGTSAGTKLYVYPDFTGAEFLDGAGSVPRGGFGGASLPRATLADGAYLYLGGTTTIDTDSHSIIITAPDDAELSLQPYAWSASLRRVTVDQSDIPDDIYWYTSTVTLQMKLSRNYLGSTRAGSLSDLRDYLVTLGPSESNLGTVPFFTTSDIASWTTEVTKATDGMWYLAKRRYEASGSVETQELLEHECRMLNGFLAQDSTGKIGFQRMRVPGPNDFSSIDLTSANIIVSRGGFPQWERNALGTLNTVTIKTQWNHREEEHTGTTYTVRDVPAASARKALKLLEIAPLSRWYTLGGLRLGLRVFSVINRFTYQDAVRIATTPLAIFGRPYSTITLDVSGADGQDLVTTALLGTFVTITHPNLPDPSTGGRGISSQPAVIIARDWDLASGVGSLTLMTMRAKRAGYAPSLWLSSTALVSGNTYDCTISYNDPASISLWESSDTGSNRIQANDKIELVDFDSLAPSIQTGTVVQWNSSTSVRVTFDAAPSFSGEQYFRFSDAAAAVSTQTLYAYWADDDGNVGFASPVVASVFG